MIFTQEKLKVEERLPAARKFIREHKLNEVIDGDVNDIGIIVMGGLTNSVLRALERVGLADVFGASRVPVLVLNVVYPLGTGRDPRILRVQARGAGGGRR